MKINLFFSPCNLDELYFTNKHFVVIDVLRSSNTIITALKNGAKEIIPVLAVEFAVKVSGGMFGGQTLLGGERNSKKIDGFALGNSPSEYTEEAISGKTIVFYTTNGTPAISKAKFSKFLIVCSFANLSEVAIRLTKMDKDFEILCAGKNDFFSFEDSICAGALIKEIFLFNSDLILSDSAKACLSLNQSHGKNLYKMLQETNHGKYLIENGFENDIKECGRLNTTKIIPSYKDNSIKILNIE